MQAIHWVADPSHVRQFARGSHRKHSNEDEKYPTGHELRQDEEI